MKLADQDKIMIHDYVAQDFGECKVSGVSNNNGVFVYFVEEKLALAFANTIINTITRVERLLDDIEIDSSDETSYNELEIIYNELKFLKELNL